MTLLTNTKNRKYLNLKIQTSDFSSWLVDFSVTFQILQVRCGKIQQITD